MDSSRLMRLSRRSCQTIPTIAHMRITIDSDQKPNSALNMVLFLSQNRGPAWADQPSTL